MQTQSRFKVQTAIVVAFIAVVSFALPSGDALARPFPYVPEQGEVWEFDLRFGENEVGEMLINFEYDEQNRLHMKSRSEGRIKVAFITVFRMNNTRHEIWRSNKLEKLDFVSTINGEEAWGRLSRQDDGTLLSEGSNGTQVVDGDLIPFAGWTPLTTTRTQIVRPVENDVVSISIERADWEMIGFDGRQAEALKFSPPPDDKGNQTHLWYDRTGRWARMDMITANGTLSFVRRSVNISR